MIQRMECRWVIIWTVLVLFLTSIPYLTGWYTACRTGETFSGFVVGVDDGNSYLAKMYRGTQGDWLFRIVYTSEPNDGRLFYLFYLLLGKLALLITPENANLPLRMIWIYHLARLFFSALLLVIVFRFIAEFITEKTGRRLAWLMVALGGGLGWLLVALGMDNWLHSMPLDFILPEGFTFLTIFTLPHIALARALFLAGLLLWIHEIGQSDRQRFWSAAVRLGVCWILMGLIVPFYPLVGGVVIGTTLVALWVSRRSFPSREALLSVVAGAIVSPVVIYSGYIFLTDPIMKGWSAQNLILSPSPLHFLAAYIVPALAAVFGLNRLIRNPAEKNWLLVSWVLVIPPLLYIPFNLQRRLIEGYQLALYTVAVIGMGIIINSRLKRLITVGVLMLMIPTSLMLVVGSTAAAASGRDPIYHSSEQVEMAQWLQQNSADDALVLSGYRTGNFLPVWAPVRVYYGHGPETIHFEQKQADVERFFSSGDSAWRLEFILENGIDYFVCGPEERILGDFCSQVNVSAGKVFEEGEWVLYETGVDDG
jgi:hypothetical protein